MIFRHLDTILNDGIFKSNLVVKFFCSGCNTFIKETPDVKDVFSFTIKNLSLKKAMKASFDNNKSNLSNYCSICRYHYDLNIHTRFKTLPKILVIEVNIPPYTSWDEEFFPHELDLKYYSTEDFSTKVSTKYNLVALIDIKGLYL